MFKCKVYNNEIKNDVWLLVLILAAFYVLITYFIQIIIFKSHLNSIMLAGGVPLYLFVLFALPGLFSHHRNYTGLALDKENNIITIFSKKDQKIISFNLSDVRYVNTDILKSKTSEMKNRLVIYCTENRKFSLILSLQDSVELKAKIGDFPKKENQLLKIFYMLFGIVSLAFIIFVILLINGLIM